MGDPFFLHGNTLFSQVFLLDLKAHRLIAVINNLQRGVLMQLSKSIFIVSVCFLLAYSSFAQAGYIDNGDGTVTDTGTGLMWQKGTRSYITWKQALAYCESLILNNDGEWTNGTANASGAKYNDWRLPTAKELASLVDTTRYNPAINTTYFPYMSEYSYGYWSSTTYADSSDSTWCVDFSYGKMGSNCPKLFEYTVRSVRSGQAGSFENLTLWPVPDTGQTQCYDNDFAISCPSSGQLFYGQDASYSINTPAYTKLAAGCTALPDTATAWAMVRDAVTGLVWEEKHNMDGVKNYAAPNDADNMYSWYDNNSATNGGDAGYPSDGSDTMDFIQALNTSNYGGFSDWRMPTDKELHTIIDYSCNPSINSTYFPDIMVEPYNPYYWSSTTYANDTGYAWYVRFFNGFVSNYSNKTNGLYVRAVRSGQCGSFGDLVIFKSGTGAGTVTSSVGKIDCGSDCTEAYTQGTVVSLTATAASGSNFAGWNGGGCSGPGSCTVTMNENLTVTATFDLVPTTTTTPRVYGGWPWPAQVPRTGQSTCYDTYGKVIACAGTGQDGELRAGVAWPYPRFTNRGDGTVSDNLTGLVWAQNANLPNGGLTWQEAIDYVAGMNAGTNPNFGYTDWRLPNVNELVSLIDPNYNGPALPQGHPFTNVQSPYWSSTTDAAADLAWQVSMAGGSMDNYGDVYYSTGCVWPVRAGQCGVNNSVICLPKTGQKTSCAAGDDGDLQMGVAWPSPRFTNNSDSVVIDILTGLMWTKNANLMASRDPSFDTVYYPAQETPHDGKVTWQNALDYVKKLNNERYLGYTDWRLPNVNELKSLAFSGLFIPTFPQEHPFTNVQQSCNPYWSSTSVDAQHAWHAWLADMEYGLIGYSVKYPISGMWSCAFLGFVWPVRSVVCFDNDSDTYGVDCISGPDCKDNDSFYTDICPTCTVKVLPKALGWFVGVKEKTRTLLVIGKIGTEFGENPVIKWESNAIEVVSTRVFFKRFMFMRAKFNGELLENQKYRVLVDECEGAIKWAN